MISGYRLSAGDLYAFAGGYPSPPLVARLRAAQLSKHLVLLRTVCREHETAMRAAVDVLGSAEALAPIAIRDLLTEPWLGVWAVRCWQGAADPAYLGAVAAVAASRAGIDADLECSVRAGRVVLPTLGAVEVAAPDATPGTIQVRDRRIAVLVGETRVSVPGEPDRDAPGWLALRRLTAGHGDPVMRLDLDDLDPHRECLRMPLADRLPAAAVARWQRATDEAWTLLVRHLPERATEFTAVIRTMVPLATDAGPAGLSATSTDAFGAFGTTFPATAPEFAVTMVHELLHGVLGALMDLIPLHEPSDGTLYYAPWRADPRPVGGLLHGTYAFAGIADAWRRLRPVPDWTERAERQFAVVREQVGVALSGLAGSGELTPAGRQFVTGLHAAHERAMAERVSPAAADFAKAELHRTEGAWRAANPQLTP